MIVFVVTVIIIIVCLTSMSGLAGSIWRVKQSQDGDFHVLIMLCTCYVSYVVYLNELRRYVV